MSARLQKFMRINGLKKSAFLALIILLVFFSFPTNGIAGKSNTYNDISIYQYPDVVAAGDAALIKLLVKKNARDIKGRYNDRDVFFFRTNQDENVYYALVGTNINQPENQDKLNITVLYDDGTNKDHSFSIKTKTVEYPEEKLTLDKKMVEPPKETLKRINADREVVIKAYSKSGERPQFDSAFILPLDSEISSIFGKRRILNGIPKRPHGGIDLRGEIGKIIKSSNSGAIVLARDLYFTGNTIIIDHGAGFFTAFFHLNKVYKKENEEVKRGEAIGEVGMTGRVTGPHLHFGVKLNGIYVNPISIIELTEKIFTGKIVTGKSGLPRRKLRGISNTEKTGAPVKENQNTNNATTE